ncbi:MAG: hypothetical protein VB144_04145 [Clostridia bacterium]|nr:hypothetical protein [Clostridia bacterium]
MTVTCYLVLNGKYMAKVVRQGSDPARTYFLHTDAVGSVRTITDAAGQLAARFEYEPFGIATVANSAFGDRCSGPFLLSPPPH